MAMATIITLRPWPRIAISEMASRMAGKASMMSTTRITSVSTSPPQYPARSPSGTPISSARPTEPKATSSETWYE